MLIKSINKKRTCSVCHCARTFLIKPTLIEQTKKISASCAEVCLPCFLKESYLLDKIDEKTFKIKEKAWETLT